MPLIKNFILKAVSYTHLDVYKRQDFLLCQVENWLCSNTLYQTKIKAKEKEIIKITHESIIHPNERRVLDFDMFSNE